MIGAKLRRTQKRHSVAPKGHPGASNVTGAASSWLRFDRPIVPTGSTMTCGNKTSADLREQGASAMEEKRWTMKVARQWLFEENGLLARRGLRACVSGEPQDAPK